MGFLISSCGNKGKMFVERFKPGSTAVRHRMRQEGHAVFADAAIVFFAVWTVLEHAAVYFGLSFEALWMIAWPASLAAIAVSIRLAFRQDSSCVPGVHDPENQRTWVWLAALIAVVFTLCLHRPDADDQCYLGLTATALDYASAPIAGACRARRRRAGCVRDQCILAGYRSANTRSTSKAMKRLAGPG